MKPVADHHTSPEQAGAVFSRVKPKLAAYSHVLRLGARCRDRITDRSAYQGPLIVGEDLTRFIIGDDVIVRKWNPELRRYPD